MPRVHIIGGAGSAINLTRELVRLGYRISAGIAHEYDADQNLWRNLDIPSRVVGAFSRIGQQDLEHASPLVDQADLTVLCSFPIGPGNEGNLELAARARRLIILDSEPPEQPRLFFSQAARQTFDRLARRAERMSYGKLREILESGTFVPSGQGNAAGDQT
jgi:iron complex transport system ATP-binding protein